MPRNPKYDQLQSKGHHNVQNPKHDQKARNPKFDPFHLVKIVPKLEQLESLHSEIPPPPPRRPMITHTSDSY